MANPSSERPFTGFYGQNSETNYQEEAGKLFVPPNRIVSFQVNQYTH